MLNDCKRSISIRDEIEVDGQSSADSIQLIPNPIVERSDFRTESQSHKLQLTNDGNTESDKDKNGTGPLTDDLIA